MECKWHQCNNEARAKSPFCSGTCKKRYQRASGTSVPVEVGQGQVGQDVDVPVAIAPGTVVWYVPDTMVYGRKAVRFPDDRFETRPEPLDHTDIPYLNNRGRYTRTDGSEYQFDYRGHNFDCKFQFTDGKQHKAVYETVADVTEASL